MSPTSSPLGCLDDIMPDIDLPMILSFACPNSHHLIAQQDLCHSFMKLLDIYPWLGGYIHSNIAGPKERCREGTKLLSQDYLLPSSATNEAKRQRIEFHDLSSHKTYKDISYPDLIAKDMPSVYLSPMLLTPDRATENADVKCAFRAKVSFIKDGVFIVLSTSHALMDATSLAALFMAWATIARGEEPAPLLHAPVDDPKFRAEATVGEDAPLGESKAPDCRGEKCDSPAIYDTLKWRKDLWHMLGLDYRPRNASSAILAQLVPNRTTVTKVFRINSAAMARLKEICTIQKGIESCSGERMRVSTNDALSALLWRCIVRARMTTTPSIRKRTSSMMYAMDMRTSKVLSPKGTQTADRNEIASGRLANIVLYSINRVAAPTLVESTSLSDVARTIRNSIQKYTEPSQVTSALQLAAAIPDVSALGLVYPTWLEHDVVISSLSHLPLYSTYWGNAFGKEGSGVPDYIRWPEGVFEGITFIMPRRRDGSVEIVVTMATADMEKLEEDMEWTSHIRGNPTYDTDR